MIRWWFTLLSITLLVTIAQAHFIFLLPPEVPENGVQLVISDIPGFDPAARLELDDPGEFWAIDATGTKTPITAKATEKGSYDFEPQPNASAILGHVDYGVVLRGAPTPILIVHYPKICFVIDPSSKPSADNGLEITPRRFLNGLAFEVTFNGQPAPDVDVSVYIPEEKRARTVRTNTNGVTPMFEQTGRFGVRVYRSEVKTGEYRGKPYQVVRHYATLVVDVPKS